MAESKSQKFEPINLGSIARGALVALFSLEGTKWKSDTMLGMKTYLERHLGKETKILA